MTKNFESRGLCDWCGSDGIIVRKYKSKYVCEECRKDLIDYHNVPRIEKQVRKAKRVFKTF